MVGPLSAAGTMCERMHAVHRWCVTGKAVLLPRPLCPLALLPARQLVALQLMAAFSSANLPCRALPALRHTDGRAPERACRPARPAAHPAAPALWRWVLSGWCSASVPCPGWPQSLQKPLPCRPPCMRLECNQCLYDACIDAQAPVACALSRRRRHLAPHDCGQDCRRRGGPGGRGWLGPAGPRAAPADVAQHQVSGGPGVPPAPPHAAPHLAGLPGRRARLLRPGAGSSATSAQFE